MRSPPVSPVPVHGHRRQDAEALVPQRLVISADDFGLNSDVNSAVALAHQTGILTAASLMVGAPATEAAVALARSHPRLRVGLHLVLTDGRSTLPARDIPSLVDAEGRFRPRLMTLAAVRFALSSRLRRQLAAEIRAQFERYRELGLALDHANAHKHFHLHPQVLELVIEIGRDYGLRSVRLPRDPRGPLFLRPWLRRMETRLTAAGLHHNQQVIGLADTGRMDEEAVRRGLAHLPAGLTEMYFHPSLEHAAGRAELAALTAPSVRQALEVGGVRTGAYADFLGPVQAS